MASFNAVGKMIAVRILPELYNSMNIEISKINAKSSIQFQDKNINKEVLFNILLILYLSRERGARHAALKSAAKVLEGMMTTVDKTPQEEVDEARLNIPSLWEEGMDLFEETASTPNAPAKRAAKNK